jgi:hypothetical protein
VRYHDEPLVEGAELTDSGERYIRRVEHGAPGSGVKKRDLEEGKEGNADVRFAVSEAAGLRGEFGCRAGASRLGWCGVPLPCRFALQSGAVHGQRPT